MWHESGESRVAASRVGHALATQSGDAELGPAAGEHPRSRRPELLGHLFLT